MSAGPTPAPVPRTLLQQPWRLWLRQFLAVVRIELQRSFFTRRAFWIYALAFAPVLIIGAHALESAGGRRCRLDQDTLILAGIFQFYYLRLAIFFGCMGIFTWLIRGEVVLRSLHYYYLAPLRRELMVLGKFVAGVLTAAFFFGLGVFASFFLMYAHFGPQGRSFVFEGPGLGHLWAYLLVTLLACLGYGAIFLALSLLLRNPIIAGALVLGWETISGLLPAFLQKFTVTYYLKHLCPVPVPAQGLAALFTVVAEPVPAWIAVLGLVLLTAAVLTFACFRIHKLEVSYSTDA